MHLLICHLLNAPFPVCSGVLSRRLLEVIFIERAAAEMQVASIIQDTPAATCTIPYALLQKLINCPAVIASLRSQISGTSHQGADSKAVAWTANVGTAMAPSTASRSPASPLKVCHHHGQPSVIDVTAATLFLQLYQARLARILHETDIICAG